MRDYSELCERLANAQSNSQQRALGSHIFDETRQAIEELTAEVERLEYAMNPRRWSRAMSDAWHRHIPATTNAFDALREAAQQERQP